MSVDPIPDPNATPSHEYHYVSLHIVAYILCWMSVFVMPFIYYFSNPFFKEAVKKTFPIGCWKINAPIEVDESGIYNTLEGGRRATATMDDFDSQDIL